MNRLIHASIAAAILLVPTLSATSAEPEKDVTRVPVVFSEGHDTDPQDRGRPVVLVASALGVSSEIFRDAFRGVRPAPAGTKPTRDRERQNKKVLLEALGKHGITNDRLDEVSNYYRYVRSQGELWTHRAAVANALVRNGKVVGYEIVDAGAGYSSPPSVSVPNHKDARTEVTLSFGKDLKTNGSISAISVPKPKSE